MLVRVDLQLSRVKYSAMNKGPLGSAPACLELINIPNMLSASRPLLDANHNVSAKPLDMLCVMGCATVCPVRS